jgi:hypothetical protein
MLKEYQVWVDKKDGSITCASKESIIDQTSKGLLSKEDYMFNFFADSFEEAMAIYHLRMGFEPYKPLGEAKLCPNNCGSHYYPEGSGECPNCGIII